MGGQRLACCRLLLLFSLPCSEIGSASKAGSSKASLNMAQPVGWTFVGQAREPFGLTVKLSSFCLFNTVEGDK